MASPQNERLPESPGTAVTARTMTIAITLLAAVGMAREGWFHFHVEPDHPVRHIDEEYRELPPLLPREGEVGYVSDVPMEEASGAVNEGGKGRYLETQYAVAPVILRYGDATLPLVVVNFVDRSRVQEVLDRHRLVRVAPIGIRTTVARPR